MTTMAPPARPDRRHGLHDYLVAGIRDLIVRGSLEAGARLAETELCARFGVSRTPLREALKALSVEELVLLQPNRGATVAPLDPKRLQSIFEAKGAIEYFIGMKAAVRASDAEIADLKCLHESLVDAEAADLPQRYTELNEAFHLKLAQLAGNDELYKVYERLQQKILRARHKINDDPARVRASLVEHEGIMAAMVVRARLDLADRLVSHNEATAAVVIAKVGN
jgi:DNA-binding GntR family transcriptional regulator